MTHLDIQSDWVPITPVKASWEKLNQLQERTQIPLVPAWAITIHKSQGLTLEKAVIELEPKEFSGGLSFVAISRVKILQGLAFKSYFSQQRLEKPQKSSKMQMLIEDNQKRAQLENWELETFGVDLSMYINNFTDPYIE